MLVAIIVLAVVLFAVAYRVYGGFLDRQFGIDPDRATPARTRADGLDYVATRPHVLAGHHFSSIAGAGPIVGPIIATAFFGWAPAVLWIVLGAIFIGGVHDYASLVVSVRNRARSVAQVARRLMSPTAHRLYLVFIWLAMVYVLTAFIDLTAQSFAQDGGVASSSAMYIALAVALGVLSRRPGSSVSRLSVVFVPLVFAAVWLGQQAALPQPPPLAHGDPRTTWAVVLVGYCFVASVTPVWVLLQPRDYLSSFLLVACIVGGLGGIFLGGAPLRAPAFTGFSTGLGYLFPALFITIACGACSGFHSIVASGTTSKQLASERHARPVAYGSMLVEGVLALISVATIAVVGGALGGQKPTLVFARGMGTFMQTFGVPSALGASFGLLALSTFLLTTLDTGTRLARYILEELFGVWGMRAHVVATVATLALPLGLSLVSFTDAAGQPVPVWRAVWPVFGATNQLLGALALLTVTVWLRRTGRRTAFTAVPMAFMCTVTLIALVQIVTRERFSLIGSIAALLLVLACVLIAEAVRAWKGERVPDAVDDDPPVGADDAVHTGTVC